MKLSSISSHLALHGTQYVVVALLGFAGTGFVSFMDNRHTNAQKYRVDRIEDEIVDIQNHIFNIRIEIMRNKQYMKHSPVTNPARGFIQDGLHEAKEQLKMKLKNKQDKLALVMAEK